MKMRVKLKRRRKFKYEEQYDWNMLKDARIKEKYNIEAYDRFQSLYVEERQNLEEGWKDVKITFTEAGKNTVSSKVRKAKQNWITKEFLDMMARRKQAKNDDLLYAEVDREISKECTEAKEKWWNIKRYDISGEL